MPPITVEFAGLPGAGKTTIAKGVVAALTAKGYSCFSSKSLYHREVVKQKRFRPLFRKLEVLYHLIFCLVKYHLVTQNALRYAFEVTPLNLAGYRRILMLVTRLELMSQVSSADHDFLVFDEGVVQNIWSMAVTGNPPPNEPLIRLLDAVLDEMTLAIILVDTDIDTAVRRIRDRATSHSRFDRMPPDQATEMLSVHGRQFERIVNCAVEIKADCLRVEGSRPVEENVVAVADFVDALWQVQKGLGCPQ